MKVRKGTFNLVNSRYDEKSVANHPALEIFLVVLFFALLILTAAAFMLLSPLFMIPAMYQ
jgi:hypothetical protein